MLTAASYPTVEFAQAICEQAERWLGVSLKPAEVARQRAGGYALQGAPNACDAWDEFVLGERCTERADAVRAKLARAREAGASVCLVGCGASKAKRARPARELYTSRLFVASMAYAEATSDRVFVVSAKHGLLARFEWVEPYDRRLADLGGVKERDAWGERVVVALERSFASPRVTLLMGDSYARHLRGPLRFRASEHYTGGRWPAAAEPLRGVSTINARATWLERATKEAKGR